MRRVNEFAQLFERAEVLLDSVEVYGPIALEAAAVIVELVRAVVESARLRRVVVRRVAVGEAVGHDEIDNVVGREALKAPLALKRRGHFKRRVRRPAAFTDA